MNNIKEEILKSLNDLGSITRNTDQIFKFHIDLGLQYTVDYELFFNSDPEGLVIWRETKKNKEYAYSALLSNSKTIREVHDYFTNHISEVPLIKRAGRDILFNALKKTNFSFEELDDKFLVNSFEVYLQFFKYLVIKDSEGEISRFEIEPCKNARAMESQFVDILKNLQRSSSEEDPSYQYPNLIIKFLQETK